MTFWILLVVIAQAINAVVSLIDKYIVSSKEVGNPVRLTFLISVLSILSILVFLFAWIPVPFKDLSIPSIANVSTPSLQIILFVLCGAVTFIAGLYSLFKSFQMADASDVVPVVSSVNAVVTLFLSFYILDAAIPPNFLWGFLFLVLGMFLVARFRFDAKRMLYTFISGSCFAIHYIVLKALFEVTHFDNAFFWSRIGIVIISLFLLFHPVFRKKEKAKSQVSKDTGKHGKGYMLLLGNKVLAGLASLLLLKAISLGDVAIVQALAGVQFLFLLVFSVFWGNKSSKHLGENVTHVDRVQKIISISVLVAGFSLLFI